MVKNIKEKSKIDFYLNTVAKFCDKCGTKYTSKDLKIIQDNQQSSIIHFNCSNCKSRHVATFVSSLGMSSRTNINTDLNIDEINDYSNISQVMVDEVLDINEHFKKKTSITI